MAEVYFLNGQYKFTGIAVIINDLIFENTNQNRF